MNVDDFKMRIKKFNAYIPDAEGYIKGNYDFYIDVQKICTVKKDVPLDATRLELDNGNIYYVTNTVDEVIKEIENADIQP